MAGFAIVFVLLGALGMSLVTAIAVWRRLQRIPQSPSGAPKSNLAVASYPLSAGSWSQEVDSHIAGRRVFSGLSKREAEELLDCLEYVGRQGRCDIDPRDGTFTVRVT